LYLATSKKLEQATLGLYLKRHRCRPKSKKSLCDNIKEGQYPLVHGDSLTYWGNYGAEVYGLTVGDILKLQPGETFDVILLDRNVGDIMHGTPVGTRYSPLEQGLTYYGSYTHIEDLTGILYFYDLTPEKNPWQWEINLAALTPSDPCSMFWGPIPDDIDIDELDPNIKVGWRGPALKREDAEKLPLYVKHYGNWWDDYMPFRCHNFNNC
jgi:hypothetical protein